MNPFAQARRASRSRTMSTVALAMFLSGLAVLVPSVAQAQDADPWDCGTVEDPGPSADGPFCRGPSEFLFVWESVVHLACDPGGTSVYTLRMSSTLQAVPDAVVHVDGEVVGSFPLPDGSAGIGYVADAFEISGVPTSIAIATADGTTIREIPEWRMARTCLDPTDNPMSVTATQLCSGATRVDVGYELGPTVYDVGVRLRSDAGWVGTSLGEDSHIDYFPLETGMNELTYLVDDGVPLIVEMDDSAVLLASSTVSAVVTEDCGQPVADEPSPVATDEGPRAQGPMAPPADDVAGSDALPATGAELPGLGVLAVALAGIGIMAVRAGRAAAR